MSQTIDGETRLILQYDDFYNPGHGIWHDVGSLLTIGDIGGDENEIDVTTFDDVDGFRRFIPGFKDAGRVEFTLSYEKNVHNLILYSLFPRENWNYRIVLRENDTEYATFEFKASFVEQGQSIKADDKIESSFAMKVSGESSFVVH